MILLLWRGKEESWRLPFKFLSCIVWRFLFYFGDLFILYFEGNQVDKLKEGHLITKSLSASENI